MHYTFAQSINIYISYMTENFYCYHAQYESAITLCLLFLLSLLLVLPPVGCVLLLLIASKTRSISEN
jgi:ABC-type molybdate transport system permease subunit